MKRKKKTITGMSTMQYIVAMCYCI